MQPTPSNVLICISISKLLLFHSQNCFIPANVADFQAEGLCFAAEGGVPEFFGLFAVADHKAVFVDLDFTSNTSFWSL